MVFLVAMVLPVSLYTRVSPMKFVRACGKVALVALSPTPVSDGGGYQALVGAGL